MELPQIGKYCEHSSCKQLDFLPLQCKCGRKFCSEHFSTHSQFCNDDAFVTDLKKIENVYKCSHSNCRATSVVPLICSNCNKHFCISHRHIVQCTDVDPHLLQQEREKYAAPVRQFNVAKAYVDRQLDESLSKAKNSKRRETAMKVQLMRIKNKAVGPKTIPTADRVYFNISYIKDNSALSKAIFVSKSWSVGRCVDAIADECNLTNKNNKSTGRKLRLFSTDDHSVLPENFSESMDTLIEKDVIVNGQNLSIQYVDEM